MEFTTDKYGTFPAGFSENARRIVSQQYFRNGETDFGDTVRRVVRAISGAGAKLGYFVSKIGYTKETFEQELTEGLLQQRFSFNSPVWYNVGLTEYPQCSACFIQPVEDSMEGIMQLATNEALLFKHGSGTGTNLSTLRSSKERLSLSDGYASGPVSFMRGYDAFAGVIKSGGRTRRAAKMQLLEDDHPDLMDFIWCKAEEDQKARMLIDSGLDPEEAYSTVAFQNANLSVRLSDAFMSKNDTDGWNDYLGNHIGTKGEILRAIAEAAWRCGDPGVQFSDTINRRNTVPWEGDINASNPCSEFVFLDNTACNLASINLVKSHGPRFHKDVCLLITAMDIIVSMAGYPTKEIRENSLAYRPLGLGYTNLGAMLAMSNIPYSSQAAREVAANITEGMTTTAAAQSAKLASVFGPHKGYCEESENVLREQCGGELPVEVQRHGVRNAQLTLLAPTGTISFMMDCDSTGIEPVFAPSMKKHLANGEVIDIEPKCFDKCSTPAKETAVGPQAVPPEAHVLMMAAVQPYLSGAISKTVNLPSSATVEDIANVYETAWKLGVKCVAVYRDGCKGVQPLKTDGDEPDSTPVITDRVTIAGPGREKMPETRKSTTHKFTVGGTDGYVTVGFYEDGRPGELFVNISKEGSTIGGLCDAWATAVSLGLQYGVPLAHLVRKFKGSRFDPAGFTGEDEIPAATSIVDYIAQWLEQQCLPKVRVERQEGSGSNGGAHVVGIAGAGGVCPACGQPTIQAGSCHACRYCGWTGGCG